MKPFHAENSEPGYPPCQALERRLRELVDAGLRELFLVAAVRQGLDHLIAEKLPSNLPE